MKQQITALILAAALFAGIAAPQPAVNAAEAQQITVEKEAAHAAKSTLASFDPESISSIQFIPKAGSYTFTAGMETRGIYDIYPEWNEAAQKMDYTYLPTVQAKDKLIINRTDGTKETYSYNKTAGGYLIEDNSRADLIPEANVEISFADVESKTIPVSLYSANDLIAEVDVPYTEKKLSVKGLTYKKGANGIALYGKSEYPGPFSAYGNLSANTGADVDMIAMNGTMYEFWYFSSVSCRQNGTERTQYYGCFKERNKTEGEKEIVVLFENLSAPLSDNAAVSADATICGEMIPKGSVRIGVQKWNGVSKEAVFGNIYQVKVGKGSSIDFAVTPDHSGTFRFDFDFRESTKGILPGISVIDDAAYRRFVDGDDSADYFVASKTVAYGSSTTAKVEVPLTAGRRYVFHLEEGTGSRMDVSLTDPLKAGGKDVIIIDAVQKTAAIDVNPGSSNEAERNTVILGKGSSKAMYKIKGGKAIYYRCLAPKSRTAVSVANHITISGRGRFYVKSIDSKAFSGRKKLRRVDIYAERLTKSGVRGCFKGLKVKKVRVYYYLIDKYYPFFTKKVTKNKVKISLKYF